jgi:hypothetical protein
MISGSGGTSGCYRITIVTPPRSRIDHAPAIRLGLHDFPGMTNDVNPKYIAGLKGQPGQSRLFAQGENFD